MPGATLPVSTISSPSEKWVIVPKGMIRSISRAESTGNIWS